MYKQILINCKNNGRTFLMVNTAMHGPCANNADFCKGREVHNEKQ